jgi:hypothetical protein
MAMRILWLSPVVPEERKKAQWENIIRFELGEAVEGIDVTLKYAEEHHRWRVDAGPDAHCVPAYRERLVDALRAAGKPAE